MVQVIDGNVAPNVIEARHALPGKLYKDKYGWYHIGIKETYASKVNSRIYAVTLYDGAHITNPEYKLTELNVDTLVLQ